MTPLTLTSRPRAVPRLNRGGYLWAKNERSRPYQRKIPPVRTLSHSDMDKFRVFQTIPHSDVGKTRVFRTLSHSDTEKFRVFQTLSHSDMEEFRVFQTLSYSDTGKFSVFFATKPTFSVKPNTYLPSGSRLGLLARNSQHDSYLFFLRNRSNAL